MWRLKKQPSYELDLDTAGQMLNHVLDVCNYEHASVPIEVLSSYSKYRRERYVLQRSVIIGLLVLFLLLPMLFLTPTLSFEGPDDRLILHVDSMMSVQSVTAALDGRPIAIYDAGNGSYVLQPTANGELTVSVRLINRQLTTISRSISGVDAQAPVYVESRVEGDDLLLFFNDDCTGIDPDSVYATLEDGTTCIPAAWDPQRACVVMPYPTVQVHLYVSDHAGHMLHMMLTPQK